MNIVKIVDHEKDIHTQQVFWLCVVLPYKIVDPLDRQKLTTTGVPGLLDVTLSSAKNKSVEIDGVYVLDSDVVAWSVSSNKATPHANLGMSLRVGKTDWLQKLSSGDWCLFWAFDNKADYERILNAVRQNYSPLIDSDFKSQGEGKSTTAALNDFNSGLKFVGQINSIRQSFSRNGASGAINSNYEVTARSFTEFNAVLFFDPITAFHFKTYTQFLGNYGVTLDTLFSSSKENAGFLNVTKFIPNIANIILGTDPNQVGDSAESGFPNLKDSPDKKLLVPDALIKMLGADGSRVVDIHRYYSGRQTYQPSTDKASQLVPVLSGNHGNIFYTPNKFSDLILPSTFDMKGSSAWGIMKGYANEPINELFTAIKPDPLGSLMPSIIFRTNPLSSDDLARSLESTGGTNITPFSQYPAWDLDLSIVTDYNLGKSDDARINYLQISTSDVISNAKNLQTEQSQKIFSPPATVLTDIERHGLRMYVQKVPARAFDRTITPQKNKARVYTAIMGDILLDSHLKYSGSVSMEGVQLPISHGDNCIISGMLAHIEAVSHSGHIDGEGFKSFETRLSVSHGIPLKAVIQGGGGATFQEQENGEVTLEMKDSQAIADARNSRTDLEDFQKLSKLKIGPV